MSNRIDLTGQIFGRLTVIEYSHTLSCRAYWKCLCECGNEKIIDSGSLKRHKTKSCGCVGIKQYRSNSPNWTGVGDMPGSYWRKCKNSANERNLLFNITKEYLWDLFLAQGGKCALTGVELKFKSHSFNSDGTASLDRINSHKGYTIGNVQWLHKDVNFMKQDMSQQDFINYSKLIANYNKNK